MHLQARSKINWTLDIVRQRADGYHLMDMLMQPGTLADDITLVPAEEITLTTGGTPCSRRPKSPLPIGLPQH